MGRNMFAVAMLLVASVWAVGCDHNKTGDATDNDTDTDADADTGLEIPVSDTADGSCLEVPPAADFNPLSGFEPVTLSASQVVTSANDSGAGTLRFVLAEAADGDVIGFATTLAGETISLVSELSVNASVIIDGTGAPGVTLRGSGDHPLITTAKAKDVTIVALGFSNGTSETSGGAIHAGQTDENQSGGRLTIRGCSFDGNKGGRGGAIRVGWRTEGIIEDSVFTNNDGTIGGEGDRGFSGGAISTSQNAMLTVRRCRFEDNVGHNGGAIYNILQPLIVEDSVFINNTANTSGAIFTDGGNGVGPSNDPSNRGEVTLRRIRIEGSSGSGAGGALMLWCYPGDEVTISGSIFVGNQVTEGGDGGKGGCARIHNPGSLLIKDTTFADNTAFQQGGALWMDGDGPVVMENVTFHNNRCEGDAGGGFNYNGHGIVRLNGCLFSNNYAGRASGAFWFGDSELNMTVANTIFAFNEAGQNIGERHMGYRPTFEGGILEFVETDVDRGRVTEDSIFADPMLELLQELDGMLVQPLREGSPAIDAGTGHAPAGDVRGALRDDVPDIGPFEFAAVCE